MIMTSGVNIITLPYVPWPRVISTCFCSMSLRVPCGDVSTSTPPSWHSVLFPSLRSHCLLSGCPSPCRVLVCPPLSQSAPFPARTLCLMSVMCPYCLSQFPVMFLFRLMMCQKSPPLWLHLGDSQRFHSVAHHRGMLSPPSAASLQ